MISIHALRGEGDGGLGAQAGAAVVISIHALRGEGDRSALCFRGLCVYFYPRPPWGGRRVLHPGRAGHDVISIHALRGEGDLCKR